MTNAAERICVSFEFFPPTTAAMEQNLWRAIEHLSVLEPRFVSVTYGADGSTRERTHNAVRRVLGETRLTAAPHLTCVGTSRAEVDDIAREYWDTGVRHLVALRGDPPKGVDIYLRFRDRCARAGIDSQIVPGILPITRFPELKRFAERCGASVPDWLRERFDGLEDDAETRKLVAASIAIEQVALLRKEGVCEFHFYTLNRHELTYAICHTIGVRPRKAA